MMLRFIAPVLLILLCSTQTEAQLNLYAGYQANFVYEEDGSFNSIVDIHNRLVALDDVLKYDQQFSGISYMNGAEMGLSYRYVSGRVQLGWMNKRRQVRAEGQRLPNQDQFENRISTTINTINVGYYPTFDRFFLGATIDYNFLRIRTDFDRTLNGLNLKTKSNSNAWSSHFSVGYALTSGGSIGLVIEPFIQVYWSEFDLGEFQDNLLGSEFVVPPSTGTNETFAAWGFSIKITNGPQRR